MPAKMTLLAAMGLAGLAACNGERAENSAATAEPPAAAAPMEAAEAAENRDVEGTSFAGAPLYRNTVPAERMAELAALAAPLEAKASLTEGEYIELGRHYIAGNRFRDAIDLYSRGIAEHPDSFKLLRHRGHRYINLRELDNAIVDLERAVALIGDEHNDVLEYNASGEPTATYEHWVYYHIGLYHYLNENWEQAAAAYKKCVDTATTNPGRVGATDWLYNAYQKGGMTEQAEAAIAAIPADLDTNTGHPYFKRVMVYKGEWQATDFVDIERPGEQWSAVDITVGYGIANWYRFNGDADRAATIHQKILQTPYWNSWAWVVTDKEYEDR